MVPEQYLEELRKSCPTKPHYMERTQNESQKMIAKWNLVVPLSLINRSWEVSFENFSRCEYFEKMIE